MPARNTPSRPELVRDYEEVLKDRRRTKRSGKIETVDISHIMANPWQPRIGIDETSLQPLVSSIERYGFLGHLEARHDPITGKIQLAYGHRRLEAARMAGKKVLPLEYVEYSDEEMMEIALVENTMRVDLTPWEEAQQIEMLMRAMKLSLRGVATLMGVSKSYIENRLALLKLPESLRRKAESGELEMTVALAISRLRRMENITDEEIGALVDAYERNELTGEQYIAMQKAFVAMKEEFDERGAPVQTVTLVQQALKQTAGPDPLAVADQFTVLGGAPETLRFDPKPLVQEFDNEQVIDRQAVADLYGQDAQWLPQPVKPNSWTRPEPRNGEWWARQVADQIGYLLETVPDKIRQADFSALPEDRQLAMRAQRDQLVACLNEL